MKNTDNPSDKGGHLTFTPGGPRRSDKVQMVSGAALGGDHGSDDYATPPGGRRHRSRVRRIESGGSFTFSTELVGALRGLDAPGPPDAANWITFAGWMNSTGQAITRFSTTWKVPPPPTTVASQLLYLFNGLEPGDGKIIVQPVLQWGDSGADNDGQNRTGPYWTAASWIVGGPDDSATHTPHVRVNPGDVLTGTITLVSQSSGGFSYRCEFQGVNGTSLVTPEIGELLWCVQTLEAYELQGAHNPPYDLDSHSEYPPAAIAFDSINIVTNAPAPKGSWIPTNVVSNYGEHTTVDRDTSVNGEVVVHL